VHEQQVDVAEDLAQGQVGLRDRDVAPHLLGQLVGRPRPLGDEPPDPRGAPGVQGGHLRPLAVTTKERSAQLPDVPTVAEQGLPDYELYAWFVLAVPAATPAPIIARLNAAVRHAAADATLRERLGTGFGMAVRPTSPEEAAAFMRAETVKWTSAIRAAGIEPE